MNILPNTLAARSRIDAAKLRGTVHPKHESRALYIAKRMDLQIISKEAEAKRPLEWGENHYGASRDPFNTKSKAQRK